MCSQQAITAVYILFLKYFYNTANAFYRNLTNINNNFDDIRVHFIDVSNFKCNPRSEYCYH